MQHNENINDRKTSRESSFDLIDRKNSEERKINNYCEKETMEIDEDSYEKPEDSNNFMRVSERMDIEKILGVSEEWTVAERGL